MIRHLLLFNRITSTLHMHRSEGGKMLPPLNRSAHPRTELFCKNNRDTSHYSFNNFTPSKAIEPLTQGVTESEIIIILQILLSGVVTNHETVNLLSKPITKKCCTV